MMRLTKKLTFVTSSHIHAESGILLMTHSKTSVSRMRSRNASKSSLQSHLSNVCGQYYVAYFLLRCNGFPMRTIVSIFGTDLVANDCRVFVWLK